MALHVEKTLKNTIQKKLPKSQKLARKMSVPEFRYNRTIFLRFTVIFFHINLDEKIISNEQKVTSNEQKVTSNEQKVTINEQKVTSSEQKVRNNKQEVTSDEQRVKSPGSLKTRKASKDQKEIPTCALQNGCSKIGKIFFSITSSTQT